MPEAKKEQDLLNRGNNLWGEGKPLEAITKYMEAIQANPEFTSALSQMLAIVISRLIENNENCSEFEKAIIYARFWVEISNRQNYQIYLYLAKLLLKNGEIEEAISTYEKAFDLQPKQPTWVLEQMVEALEQNKQGEKGIFTYEQKICSNANHGYFSWALGDIFAKKNELNKATINYKKALKFLPKESFLHGKLAMIFNQKGDLDQAIANYQQAIILEPNNFNFYWQLAEIQKQKGDLDQAISNYQQAIKMNSNNLSCYNNYFELWSKKDNTEQAIKKCIALLEELCTTNYLIHEFIFNIIQQHGTNEQKCQFLNIIPLKEEDVEIFQKIWQNLNHQNIENIEFENNHNVDPEKVKLYFLKKTSDYKSININQQLKKEELLLLQHHGLSLNYLQLNLYKSRTETMADRGKLNQNLPKEVLNLMNKNEFQKKLITQGKISCICPFTGELLYSDTCIPYVFHGTHHCNYFFRFNGREVFYLITGFVSGEKIALYFPNSEIIISFKNFNLQFLKLLELTVNFWKSYLVSNANKVAGFFNYDQKFSKKIILLGLEHLGHHLWNNLSGIYQIYEWNQLENIDKFFVADQPLGKLEDIFPEIPPNKINSINFFNEDYVNLVVDNNYLPITYGSNFVKQDLADRIYQAAVKNCSPAVIKEIEDARKQHFPLLWINIRTGSRSWLSQIEGTANIINNLSEDFPNLGIVFDGISLLEGESNNYFSQIMEAENKVVREIKNLIHKKVKTYNFIGRIIYENLVCVNKIDLYLSHWGNALTKSVLIANKPGVVHCNKEALKVPITERWISWHRENCVLPTYISSDDIQDFSVISYDTRNTLDNYDIDWQVIYQELLKVIPQCERYHSQMEYYYKSRREAIKTDLESSRFRLAEIREKLSQISQKDISSPPRS